MPFLDFDLGHKFTASCFQAIRVIYSVGKKCGYLLKKKKI